MMVDMYIPEEDMLNIVSFQEGTTRNTQGW